jgi:tyrosine-protein kinase Etk/Wzc
MGTSKQDKDEKLLITLSDIIKVFRKSSKTILLCMICFGVLGGLFALTRPIRYQAEATFREKAKKSGQLSSSIMQMLSSDMSAQENEASQMIKSRKLLTDVIARLNLQAHLLPKSNIEGMSKLLNYNLKLALANFFNKPDPVLSDWHSPLKIDYLHYDGEVPLDYEVLLADNGEFEVLNKRRAEPHIGFGKLDEPFIHDSLMMVLSRHSPEEEIVPQSFFLRVESVADTCKQLCRGMDVETTKEDKGVLKITYSHRNRHLASQFINTTMEAYQNYLQNYHNKISQLQLNYLHKRQGQLGQNLTGLMERHAAFLSEDLFSSGFVNSDKEMDFLAENQHEYKEKLIANELEIKRLENAQSNIYVHYDHYSMQGDGYIINDVLNQIRDYKQRRDGLEIEIQSKMDRKGIQESFDQQIKDLKQVQNNLIELRDIVDRFNQNIPPDENSALYNDHRFLIKGWFERLEKHKDQADKQKVYDNFHFYLMNLERLFLVNEKILQERLTHQQNPSKEYQGIDFKAANELYIDYSKQLIQVESTIRQSLFFINQMEDPDFEITSLSSVLSDPVSQDMIKKASNLVLTLRDQNNQSLKEQERIKDELHLQRTFLTLHLKQSVQLMELNKQLIDEKIYALQNVSLELVHRHISLLENTLKDYLESRLENLRQDRVLIKEHLKQIRDEMTNLPKKWVAEQMIEQEVETNQLIVQEIAKMVESKNITQNLEMIQSAPLDVSIPPVHPVPPKVLLFAILGMFFGGLLGTGIALGRTVTSGINASPENLRPLGYHVTGTFSPSYDPSSDTPINDEDLETLRRLQTQVDSSKGNKGNLILLVEGQGPDYSKDLADLFKKRNKKVLRIYLDFSTSSEELKNGLLQYLEGSATPPAIQTGKHGDVMLPGGVTRFATELLSSDTFKSLIEELKMQYDWIIGVTHLSPMSIETEALLPLFSNAALTLTDEKIDDLKSYMEDLGKKEKKNIVFLFHGKQK